MVGNQSEIAKQLFPKESQEIHEEEEEVDEELEQKKRDLIPAFNFNGVKVTIRIERE
jgi:hypothetical protein